MLRDLATGLHGQQSMCVLTIKTGHSHRGVFMHSSRSWTGGPCCVDKECEQAACSSITVYINRSSACNLVCNCDNGD
uniref:Uncharacterized protein n=1 Tax=Arundo donax TaxID=35708 RepID=A0A0A8YGZ2_ARUDO